MQVNILGTGDAFSTRCYSSCFLVEHEGCRLLVDCPHPIRKILAENARPAVDIADIDAVVLTHLHADHSSGLQGFVFFAHLALGRKVQLITHPKVIERMWNGHLAASMDQILPSPGAPPVTKCFDDYFDVTLLDDNKPVAFGPFTIACHPTIHHIPTYAMRITASGRTLGCSSDTVYDPELLAWLACADIVIHEANTHELHTPVDRLEAQPKAVRDRLRLIHYPDHFDVAACSLPVLSAGERFDV